MKNLKRTLSLVLAVALCFSLLAIGASAKTYKDDSSITYKEAVQWLSTLGVMNGEKNDDGTYSLRPADPITRAEFTKLVCFVMNGGTEPALGDATTTSFKDTKGHWAAKYIEFLVSAGYIAGYGDGTFGPDDTITGQQAAKILLTVLGYNASYEGLVGGNWAYKADTLANTNKLYDNLGGMQTSNLLKREQAAQMIWNCINAYMVSYDTAGTIGNKVVRSKDTKPLNYYFDVTLAEGVLVGNSYGKLESQTSNKDTITYNPTVSVDANGVMTYGVTSSDILDGKVLIRLFALDSNSKYQYVTFDTDTTTSDMLGESVRFAYKTSSVNGSQKTTIVGAIQTTDYNKSYTDVKGGDIKDSTVGMKFDVDETTPTYKIALKDGGQDNVGNKLNTAFSSYDTKLVYNYGLIKNNDQAADRNSSAYAAGVLVHDISNNLNKFKAGQGWTTQFIDYDNDGTCDYIKVFTAIPYKVVNVDSASVTLSNLAISDANDNARTRDVSKFYNIADGSKATVKIGDIILAFTDALGKTWIDKSSSFTGTVTAVKDAAGVIGRAKTLTIDGTAYGLHDVSFGSDGSGINCEDLVTSGSVNLNTMATFYKDQYGKIFYIDTTSTGSVGNVKFALVTSVDPNGFSYSANGYYIAITKTDGTNSSALVKQYVTGDKTFTTTTVDSTNAKDGATAQANICKTDDLIAYTTAADGSLKIFAIKPYTVNSKNMINFKPAAEPANGDIKATTGDLTLDNDYAKLKDSNGNAWNSMFTSSDTVYVNATDNLAYTGYSNVPETTFNVGASSVYIVNQTTAYKAMSALNGGTQVGSDFYAMYLFYKNVTTSNTGSDLYFYIASSSHNMYYNSDNEQIWTYTGCWQNGVAKALDINTSKVAFNNPKNNGYNGSYLYKITKFGTDGKTITGMTPVKELLSVNGDRTTPVKTRVAFIDSGSLTTKIILPTSKVDGTATTDATIDNSNYYNVDATYIINSETKFMDVTAAPGHEFLDRTAVLKNYTVYVQADENNVALVVYVTNKGQGYNIIAAPAV